MRFTGLLKDLFPAAKQSAPADPQLFEAIKVVYADLKLTYTETQVRNASVLV